MDFIYLFKTINKIGKPLAQLTKKRKKKKKGEDPNK
jgi:hypothetical protein